MSAPGLLNAACSSTVREIEGTATGMIGRGCALIGP
jgi:hypothetical protein